MIEEPTTVGIGEDGQVLMKLLVDAGQVHQLLDAYRFFIAFSIGNGLPPSEMKSKSTFVNVGTLDPDREIYYAVRLSDSFVDGTSVYKHAERLADSGAHALRPFFDGEVLDL